MVETFYTMTLVDMNEHSKHIMRASGRRLSLQPDFHYTESEDASLCACQCNPPKSNGCDTSAAKALADPPNHKGYLIAAFRTSLLFTALFSCLEAMFDDRDGAIAQNADIDNEESSKKESKQRRLYQFIRVVVMN